MSKEQQDIKCKSIGGQAVIEGVMMREKADYAVAVRKPDQSIEVIKNTAAPLSAKYPILKWPIIRGVASFIDSLVMGMKLITMSADMAGLDDMVSEEPSKFEKWLEKTFGDKLNKVIVGFSSVLGILLAMGLFMLLPVYIGGFFSGFLGEKTWALGIVEGLARIAIFVVYVALVSLSKDIKRVFGYHGAEHKTIHCYEHGDELTVENARKYPRLHKRCGTNFLFIVMILSMLLFVFIRTDVFWLRIASRLLLVPLIAGLSYELIKLAGKYDNAFINLISLPGMLLQKITTAEPDDGMLETAIEALNAVK